jgi:vacuolar-type H+-ATPase subunit H
MEEEPASQQQGKAADSLNDKARALVSDAKKKSKLILQAAEKEAESITAQSKEIVQEAVAILAGAAKEVKRWKAEKTALAKVQYFGPIVKLNIGSMRFETSLTTLRRFPDTMIGCMFSGRHALPRGKDGYFFVDRDGTHFRHILNFLRSPESYKPGLTGAEEVELLGECKYYGIDQLMFPGTQLMLPLVPLR